jgi:hypothetical protein
MVLETVITRVALKRTLLFHPFSSRLKTWKAFIETSWIWGFLYWRARINRSKHIEFYYYEQEPFGSGLLNSRTVEFTIAGTCFQNQEE